MAFPERSNGTPIEQGLTLISIGWMKVEKYPSLPLDLHKHDNSLAAIPTASVSDNCRLWMPTRSPGDGLPIWLKRLGSISTRYDDVTLNKLRLIHRCSQYTGFFCKMTENTVMRFIYGAVNRQEYTAAFFFDMKCNTLEKWIKCLHLPALLLILHNLHPSLVMRCSTMMQSPYMSPLNASDPLLRSLTVTSAWLYMWTPAQLAYIYTHTDETIIAVQLIFPFII